MQTTSFKVGDFVKWDGGADVYRPRYYHGRIKEICNGYAVVIDNEWHADNGVAFSKLEKWEEDWMIAFKKVVAS